MARLGYGGVTSSLVRYVEVRVSGVMGLTVALSLDNRHLNAHTVQVNGGWKDWNLRSTQEAKSRMQRVIIIVETCRMTDIPWYPPVKSQWWPLVLPQTGCVLESTSLPIA